MATRNKYVEVDDTQNVHLNSMVAFQSHPICVTSNTNTQSVRQLLNLEKVKIHKSWKKYMWQRQNKYEEVDNTQNVHLNSMVAFQSHPISVKPNTNTKWVRQLLN